MRNNKISLLLLLATMSSYSFADSLQELQQVLDNNKGSIIYLDFWASWCAPCHKSFPWLNHLNRKYANQKFKVISVNVDAQPALALKFLKKSPADFDVIYDPEGEIASKYQLKGMPSSFIFNKNGTIIDSHVGFFDKNKDKYEQQIVKLIEAQK